MFNPSFRKPTHKDTVNSIADEIRRQFGDIPSLSIVLGSGFADALQDATVVQEIDLRTIEGFPVSQVSGHASLLRKCSWNDMDILLWVGRAHAYEGFDTASICTATDVMHTLGCTHVCYTNAAGGLNPTFDQGDMIALSDLIDSTLGATASAGASSSVIDTEWHARCIARCAQEGVKVGTGGYVSVLGPSYETRAEIGMYRKLGADVIGMSTVKEAKHAKLLGLSVLALSLVTNVLHEVETPQLDHSHVVNIGAASSETIQSTLKSAILSA